jgi:16S rRNA (guanine(966)-N(2))-methyltransferase RsmD
LRIVAGEFKSRELRTPTWEGLRPTSDRLRETLFNVIAPRIEDARFLDLCAGSGAVGIEALSRGASHVTFVDRSRRMCKLIEANVELCRIPEEQWDIYCSEVNEFLRQSKDERWDIVFFDPPYKEDYLKTLQLLGNNELVIAEHHHKTELPDTVGGLQRSRVLKQGDSALSFFSRG